MSTSHDPFLDLSLPLGAGVNSVQTALDHFRSKEAVYKCCDKCKKEVKPTEESSPTKKDKDTEEPNHTKKVTVYKVRVRVGNDEEEGVSGKQRGDLQEIRRRQ